MVYILLDLYQKCCTTDGFFNLTINHIVFALTEIVDFKALILHCLLVAAYSDVSVCHINKILCY